MVVAPHGILASVALWLWWPKSDKEWKRFGFAVAYLLLFVAVMHFVFHAHERSNANLTLQERLPWNACKYALQAIPTRN